MHTPSRWQLCAGFSAVLAAMTIAAPAAAEFRGGGVLHGFSDCQEAGWDDRATVSVRASFDPSEGSGSPSTVSLFFTDGGALTLSVAADLEPGRTRYRGQGYGLSRTVWQWQPRPRLRVVFQHVVEPRGAGLDMAEVIDMRIRVSHFGGRRGCRATMDLTLFRD